MPKRVYITYNGETMDMTTWSKRTGIDYRTLWYRLKVLAWSPERAFTEPVQDHCLTRTSMRWCPIHEVAFCEDPVYEKHSYWHPIRRHMIAYALTYAKAFGCEKQIKICIVSCDICDKEKE